MLLAIDVGNTNIVFSVFDGEDALGSWRMNTIASRPSDEYIAFLDVQFNISGVVRYGISRVLISSVVPEAEFALTSFVKRYCNIDPVFVSKDNIAGLVSIAPYVSRPGDVGADRLVNAVAAKAHYSLPAIVIDFGTATTFDVIDGNGDYAGGVIAPGINLSVSALHQAASKLPKVNLMRPEKTIGSNTVHAMQSGVFYGYKGLIEGITGNIIAEMDAKPIVIATGGLAGLFADDSNVIDDMDADLTLKGLQIIDGQLSPDQKD